MGKKINIENKISQHFLVLSLIISVVFSLAFPIFSGHDEQYHFDATSKLVGIKVDRKQIDSSPYGSGETFNARNNLGIKGYVDKYYLTKLDKVEKVNDERAENATLFDLRQYIVPAVGLFVGYHIYPSLGVMETFARLFNAIFYSIVMYVVIKKMRHGKLIMFAIALSPTMIIQSVGASYDNINFLVTAVLLGFGIDLIFSKEKISTKRVIQLIVILMTALFFGKRNIYVTLLFAIPILMSMLIETYKLKIFYLKFTKRKELLIILLTAMLSIVILFRDKPFIIHLRQIFSTLTGNFISIGTFIRRGDYLATGMLVGTQEWDYLPVWMYGLWMILLFMLIFSESKKGISNYISVFSISLFFMNLLAMLWLYANSAADNPENVLNPNHYIIGPQGRYFTPLMPVMIFFNELIPISVINTEGDQKFIARLTYGFVGFSALFLLFKTIQSFWWLGIQGGI